MKEHKLSWLLAAIVLLSMPLIASAQTATISWNTTHQTIDGFGASDYVTGISGIPGNNIMNSTQADTIFSTSNGAGLSLLRTGVPSDGSCTSVSKACAGDISDNQLVIARGAKVWATGFSPPASMKTNGAVDCTSGGGGGTLSSGSYAAYATYLSNYIKSLSSFYGISLYAIAPANEPTGCYSGFPDAQWSDSQLDTFIKNNLGPTLAANGQSGVRIVMPESAQFALLTNSADTCASDPACASYVGILAWHDYDASWQSPNSTSNPYSSLNKGYWQTEVSAGSFGGPSLCGGCWDPSMANGLLWASIIDNRMAVANANSWSYYWVVGYNNDDEGLIGQDGVTVSKRLFVMGNYSKFVRPGWVRIDATHQPASGVTVSAYKDPVSGNFAIVATNQNNSSVQVTFPLSGLNATSVSPWVTSASSNLEQESTISVSAGSFSATLAPSSVTTFAGSAGAASGPAPPTITGITVK